VNMKGPDQRLFEEDLASVEFRTGEEKGLWGVPGPDIVPDGTAWPSVIFWLAAADRPNAPTRFYFALDGGGYRTAPPTGTFWNPDTKSVLEFAKRPKGTPGSRFAKVFRTDWEGGRAFYHPYDRVAANGHPGWKTEQPHLVWTPDHTIVDFLEEFQSLFCSGDYIGL
jgi:hypothetical protein